MKCRDVRDLAGSFLGEELLTETNHEILWHLTTCSSCRAEIEGRRRLRGALQCAFERSPALQPSSDFADRLHQQLRAAAARDGRSHSLFRRWWALAAGVVLAVGLAGGLLLHRAAGSIEALASDAIGDHKNCALKFRAVREPVPLEAAAQHFDSAYRGLVNAPPDDITMPDGPVRVTERHSCAFGERRFGHVIMNYRDHVVSLLLTSHRAPRATAYADTIPQVIGRPVEGLSVVSVEGDDHVVLLVSDLNKSELTALSKEIAVPLLRHLTATTAADNRAMAALLFSYVLTRP